MIGMTKSKPSKALQTSTVTFAVTVTKGYENLMQPSPFGALQFTLTKFLAPELWTEIVASCFVGFLTLLPSTSFQACIERSLYLQKITSVRLVWIFFNVCSPVIASKENKKIITKQLLTNWYWKIIDKFKHLSHSVAASSTLPLSSGFN